MCAILYTEDDVLIQTFTDGNLDISLAANTINHSVYDKLTEQIASALNVYYTPLLIFFGIIGNLISVFVFFNSKLRHQSTSQYLSALAISDSIFLLQLIPPWLNAMQYTGVFYRSGFCQVFVYISYVSCCLSAWLVVAFTVERFVAVVYPLKRSAVCTVTRARHIIAVLFVAAVTLNIPVLKFAMPTFNDCNVDFEYLDHAANFNLVDTALSFTVPLAIIVILNTWTMIGVCTLERARQQMINDEEPAASIGEMPRNGRHQPRSQQRVTRMLLFVSSVFVLLNLPAYTMRILAYAYDMSAREYNGRWAAVQQLALMFFNTNFGINFILYCLTGQNFRRALVQAVPWLRRWTRYRAARRAAGNHPARASSVSRSGVTNYTEATGHYYSPAALNSVICIGSHDTTGRYLNRHCHMVTDNCQPGTSSRATTCNGRPVGPGRNPDDCPTPVGRSSSIFSGRQLLASTCFSRNVYNSTQSLTSFLQTVETHPQHEHRGSFIQRWTFDNSRQRNQAAIEMQDLNRGADPL